MQYGFPQQEVYISQIAHNRDYSLFIVDDGIIPLYSVAAMGDMNVYEEAVAQLEYIEMVKWTMCVLFDQLSDASQSSMFVSASDYGHAVALIKEAIDEMYYDEACAAHKIKEAWERKD